MVNNQKFGIVNDINEGIHLGKRFCAQRSTANQVLKSFPAAQFTSDPSDGLIGLKHRAEPFIQMDSGLCDLGLIHKEDLEAEHSRGRHCNKVRIGLPVVTSPHGIPFSPASAAALGWRLQRALFDGSWDAIKLRNQPASMCEARQADALDGQIIAADMIGQTTTFLAVTFVGLVYSIVTRRGYGKKVGLGYRAAADVNVPGARSSTKTLFPPEPARRAAVEPVAGLK